MDNLAISSTGGSTNFVGSLQHNDSMAAQSQAASDCKAHHSCRQCTTPTNTFARYISSQNFSQIIFW